MYVHVPYTGLLLCQGLGSLRGSGVQVLPLADDYLLG